MPIKSLCAGWRRKILYKNKVPCLELLIGTMKKKQFFEWTKK